MNRAAWVVALSLGLGASQACMPETEKIDPNSITVGVLLPFTGATSATASNFEKAVIYAEDRITDIAGGVQGRPVHIVSADTHSDPERAIASAHTLVEAGASVVIGAESAEIAEAVAPVLAAEGVALVSPLVGAANDQTVDCTLPWFRLAPSARALGEALAKLAIAEGLTNTVVVTASDAYDEALSQAAAARFTSLGGTVGATLALAAGATSYGNVVFQVPAGTQSIILATSPRAAALFVNDFGAVGGGRQVRWFLSPLLKTDLLLENTAPSALEGALGVAPKIYDQSTDFPNAFSKQWQGSLPLEGAYFYYDAMALISFALQKTTQDSNGHFPASAFASAIRAVAAPPGQPAGWNEVESGLNNLKGGSTVYYSGLTGPMLLNSCGSRQLGVTSSWKVQAGVIKDY